MAYLVIIDSWAPDPPKLNLNPPPAKKPSNGSPPNGSPPKGLPLWPRLPSLLAVVYPN